MITNNKMHRERERKRKSEHKHKQEWKKKHMLNGLKSFHSYVYIGKNSKAIILSAWILQKFGTRKLWKFYPCFFCVCMCVDTKSLNTSSNESNCGFIQYNFMVFKMLSCVNITLLAAKFKSLRHTQLNWFSIK